MISDPTTFALGTVFGFAIGALTIIGWGLVLEMRARKRDRDEDAKRRLRNRPRTSRLPEAMDNACNELERGGE